jgi:hypothetical protein
MVDIPGDRPTISHPLGNKAKKATKSQNNPQNAPNDTKEQTELMCITPRSLAQAMLARLMQLVML